MSVHSRRRVRSSDPQVILEIAAELLSANAAASLSDVAAAAGVGRTTLHKRFPTREALILAVAHNALDRCAATYTEAGLDTVGADATPDEVTAVLRRLVELMVPLGPQVEFLLRQPSLDNDKELTVRMEQLDEPLLEFIGHAQQAGVIRANTPAWWVVSTLYALTYSAWERITSGELAPRDAAPLVVTTTLQGLGAP